MPSVTLNTLNKMKLQSEKFACLTAYDASFSRVISENDVEVMLVGDSLGMVLQGCSSTLPVTVEDMAYHTRCVANGNSGQSLIVSDMPFMSYANENRLLDAAAALMQAGAEVVKMEGEAWLNPWTEILANNGVPVCVHMGLTPQSVNKFGGYKVQGREPERAKAMVQAAIDAQNSGAALLLLECVPTKLAQEITEAVEIPVIGIGAGPFVDGQILVLHDILGVSPGKPARFVKHFLPESKDGSIAGAIQAYADAVHQGTYPEPQHAFE